MTHRSRIRSSWLAGPLLAAVLALAGCTSGPPAPPQPSDPVPSTPAASAEPSTSETPPYEVEPSTGPSDGPAPSSSGELTGADLPAKLLGFDPIAGEASEGEFNENGDFAHAVDPLAAVYQALPQCGEVSQVPDAVDALAGSYADPAGSPGNALALRFASPSAATTWFKAFTDLVAQCEAVGAAPTITADSVTDQRDSEGEVWTEAGVLRGDRVVLAIIPGSEHDRAALLAELD